MFCTGNVNQLWKIWESQNPLENKLMCVNGTNPILVGWSSGALRTNFVMKKAKKSFDAGLPCPYPIDEVYLTHGHCDHSGELFFYILNNPKIRIFVPNEVLKFTDEKIQHDFFLTECMKKPSSATYKIIGVEGGDCIPTKFMGKNAMIEIFNSQHNVPCISYGISIEQKTLKEQYIGLDIAYLRNLTKNGIEISETILAPYFLYVGDTDISIFTRPSIKDKNRFLLLLWYLFIFVRNFFYNFFPNKQNKRKFYARELPDYQEHRKDLVDYPIIMIECTYLFDEDYEYSKNKKHIHWKDLEPFIKLYNNKQFILYHFCQRYKPEQIKEFFKNCPENVNPWVSD